MDDPHTQNLIDVVCGMVDRYDAIEKDLQDPAIMADPPRYAALMKEYRRVGRIALPGRDLLATRQRIEEAQELMADPELAELARADHDEAAAEMARLLDDIRTLILTDEELSERDVIMEVRAGTGGDEASLFAADLFRMYQHFAEKRRWKIDILSANPTDLGGFKEVIFSVEGDGVYRALRFESGGHRVQRVPETEGSGRIHTSACTVAVLPEPESVEIDVKPDDIKIDTFRASGPGGQKVNKTSSAVRITHLESGLVVSCQDEKSQHKNRSKAMKILKSRLFEQEQARKTDERSAQRKSQIGSGDRSERVRTYNYPQNRVTDHRIKQNFPLQEIVAGELERVIASLEEAYKAQRLAEFEGSET